MSKLIEANESFVCVEISTAQFSPAIFAPFDIRMKISECGFALLKPLTVARVETKQLI